MPDSTNPSPRSRAQRARRQREARERLAATHRRPSQVALADLLQRFIGQSSTVVELRNPYRDVPDPPSPASSPTLPASGESTELQRPRDEILSEFAMSTGLKGTEKLIRCGFEFEFHKLLGSNSNQFNRLKFERDLAQVMASHGMYSLVQTYGYRRDYKREEGMSPSEQETRQAIERFVLGINLDSTMSSYLNEHPEELGYRPVLETYLEKLREAAVTIWIRENRARYQSPVNPADIPGFGEVADMVEIGKDSSVRGGEIRTIGGRTVREFLKAAYTLSRARWEVETDCSFHIHLSVNGIKHKWGPRFQSEMYAYILRNLNRLPEIVRQRLISKAGMDYARFRADNGSKYVAIYQHDSGTWEFRLFGGLTEFSDMAKCLLLAVDTMRHAYAVKLGLTVSLLANYATDEIREALGAIYPAEEDEVYDPETDSYIRVLPRPGLGLEGFWQYLEAGEALRAARSLEGEAA